MKHTNNRNVKIAFIYIRYLLPILLCALLIGTLFIPCLSYSTVEGTQKEISSAELFGNSWDQVRAYLFATSEREVTQERFSWTVLILLPILVLLFAVGVISAVIVAIVALMYINDHEFRKSNARIWFVTIIQNRIVSCILQGLILPLLFYPRMIILLYDKIMNIDVLLNVSFPEPWIWGLVFVAVIIIMSSVSCRFEQDMGVDPFKRIAPPIVRVIDREDEDDEPADAEPVFKSDSERVYYEQQMRARREQEELIRRLLNKNDEEEK